ncbi:MAG TPA: hypothetical protein VMB21_09970 [Candidatus Limnocylindria bacterium]|jgi:hypothetical protein|nr:hypothetical protein [Candidatus Limnocylindria bacterium]
MKLPVTKTVAALYVAAVFAIGAVAGGAVSYGYGRKQPPRKFDPEAMRLEQKNRYVRELGLNPEQAGQLDEILKQGVDEFGACHREHMDRIRELIKKNHARVAAILTAEQKVEFEKIEKAREEKFPRDNRGEHRGPPPGGEAPPPPK